MAQETVDKCFYYSGFIVSQITDKMSIQTELISLGSENLSIAFLMINTLQTIKITTVINAHKIEYLAYQ